MKTDTSGLPVHQVTGNGHRVFDAGNTIKIVGILLTFLVVLAQGIYVFGYMRAVLNEHLAEMDVHESQQQKLTRIQRELDRSVKPLQEDISEIRAEQREQSRLLLEIYKEMKNGR